MSILNFSIDSIGQSGQVPKFIYIQTNNTTSEVQEVGFLNSFVAQGNAISSVDMALVTTKDSPIAALFNISFSNDNWSLVQYGASIDAWLVGGNSVSSTSFLGNLTSQILNIGVGAITSISLDINQNMTLTTPLLKIIGIPSIITGSVLYYNSGTGETSFGAAPGGGGAFDPAGNYLLTGNWVFNAGFDINSPNEISIVSTGVGNSISITATDDELTLTSGVRALLQSINDNVFIQATTVGQQVQIYADGFNFSAQQLVNLNSVNNNVNINANNGSLNLHSGNGGSVLSSDSDINIASSSNGININTTNGDLNINAGITGTTGNLNLSTDLGNAFIGAPQGGGGFNVNNDLNFNSTVGQISLNTSGSNISCGPSGIGMGVSAGSGFSVDAVTGNFQFGANTGSFLLGSLGSTVTILGHLGITMTADAGELTFTGSTGIKLVIPTLPVSNNTPVLMDMDGTIHI